MALDNPSPRLGNDPIPLAGLPVAGPLYLNRVWIGAVLAAIAAATIFAIAFLPRSYRSEAILSVTWLAPQWRLPDNVLAGIVAHRLTRGAWSTGGQIKVEPGPARSTLSVSFEYPNRFLSAAKLNGALHAITVDPVIEARRVSLANQVAMSDRETAELSSEVALARAIVNTAPTPPAGQPKGDEVAEADQEVATAVAAADTPEAKVADFVAARDAAQSNLTTLSESYGPLYPAIIKAHAELDAANSALTDAKARRASLKARLASAQLRLRQAQATKTPPPSSSNDAQAVQLLAKLSVAEAAATLHRTALMNEAKAFAPSTPYEVKVTQAATPPKRGQPSSLLILLVALFVSPCVVGPALLFREFRATGFRSIRAAEKTLGRPVVALVPETGGGTGEQQHNPADLVAEKPESQISLVFKELIESTQIGSIGSGKGVIAICSALPSEGKTTTALCLARVAASLGIHTVIVDCDGRRGILSKSLPGECKAGLVQVLSDQASLADSIETDVSGAHFIRHSSDSTFRDLSNARVMMPVLAELATRFDLVLLDTPPVLAIAEARVLASLSQQVLFVARWRETPRAASRQAMEILARSNAHVGGIILTRVVFAGPLLRRRSNL